MFHNDNDRNKTFNFKNEQLISAGFRLYATVALEMDGLHQDGITITYFVMNISDNQISIDTINDPNLQIQKYEKSNRYLHLKKS